MSPVQKRTYRITSVQRCLRLLSLFSQTPNGLSASEVTKLSGLPVSTVHRFLVNLEEAGFLDCGGTENIIWGSPVSPSATPLSDNWIFAASASLFTGAPISTLAKRFTLLSGRAIRCLCRKTDSPRTLANFFAHRRFCSALLHCGRKNFFRPHVAGKLDKILPQIEPKRLTQNTIATIPELEQHLLRVRKAGHAFDLEEPSLTFAASLLPSGITLSCQRQPQFDCARSSHGDSRLRQLAPLIQEAGLRIRAELLSGRNKSHSKAFRAPSEPRAGTKSCEPRWLQHFGKTSFRDGVETSAVIFQELARE